MSGVGTVTQSSLHVGGVIACTDSPGVVDSEGGGNAVELNVAGFVGPVHCSELVIRHLLSDGTCLCGGGDDVEGDINDDGASSGSADSVTSHLCAAVCLEDTLVHLAHSLVEVLTGVTEVNAAVKVLVDSVVVGIGAGQCQEAGEADEDAGQMHVVCFDGRENER